MQSVQQILVAAKALIQQPNRWTQHTFARDASGDPVDPTSKEAQCWCTIGAIANVTQGSIEAQQARDYLKQFTHVKLDVFNDRMTHQGVLDAFERALSHVPS